MLSVVRHAGFLLIEKGCPPKQTQTDNLRLLELACKAAGQLIAVQQLDEAYSLLESASLRVEVTVKDVSLKQAQASVVCLYYLARAELAWGQKSASLAGYMLDKALGMFSLAFCNRPDV